jgi:hypothetical protein
VGSTVFKRYYLNPIQNSKVSAHHPEKLTAMHRKSFLRTNIGISGTLK